MRAEGVQKQNGSLKSHFLCLCYTGFTTALPLQETSRRVPRLSFPMVEVNKPRLGLIILPHSQQNKYQIRYYEQHISETAHAHSEDRKCIPCLCHLESGKSLKRG